MKETIKYYYDTYIEELNEINNGYYFYFNNYKYYFVLFDRDIRELELLFKTSNELYNKNILVNTFILTKDGKYYVRLEYKVYVMLRVNSIEDYKYTMKEILHFNNVLLVDNSKINMIPWSKLWSSKIDIFESEISEFNKEYPLIQSTFNYYVGLAENAISYINDTFIDEDSSTFKVNLNHKRIGIGYQGYVNNPLTFTFDYSVRDIAEYIKFNFFNNKINYKELEEILLSNIFNKGELRLFYGRLLYPSYYLDEVKRIVIYNLDESVLNKYIDKIGEYEFFLKEIYYIIRKKNDIPIVEWVVNKK